MRWCGRGGVGRGRGGADAARWLDGVWRGRSGADAARCWLGAVVRGGSGAHAARWLAGPAGRAGEGGPELAGVRGRCSLRPATAVGRRAGSALRIDPAIAGQSALQVRDLAHSGSALPFWVLYGPQMATQVPVEGRLHVEWPERERSVPFCATRCGLWAVRSSSGPERTGAVSSGPLGADCGSGSAEPPLWDSRFGGPPPSPLPSPFGWALGGRAAVAPGCPGRRYPGCAGIRPESSVRFSPRWSRRMPRMVAPSTAIVAALTWMLSRPRGSQ